MSRRSGLVKELPEEIQQRVRWGQILPHAAMKYLVPLARANRRDCLRLAEAVGGRRLSSRQMEKLYSAWVSGDEPLRELVLSQPELFPRVEQEAQRAPSVGARPVEGLMSDLSVLGAVCVDGRSGAGRWGWPPGWWLPNANAPIAFSVRWWAPSTNWSTAVRRSWAMLDQSLRNTILTLKRKAWSTRQIARELGISRRTVKKVLRTGSASPPLDPPGGESRTLSGRDSGCRRPCSARSDTLRVRREERSIHRAPAGQRPAQDVAGGHQREQGHRAFLRKKTRQEEQSNNRWAPVKRS